MRGADATQQIGSSAGVQQRHFKRILRADAVRLQRQRVKREGQVSIQRGECQRPAGVGLRSLIFT